MTSRAKVAQLSALIKARRKKEGLGLREAAKASGVSPSTLSRLERNVSSLPDLDTLNRITSWLNISVEAVIGDQNLVEDEHPTVLNTMGKIELHLRADKDLKPETAEGF